MPSRTPNGIWSAGPIRRPWYWVCPRISKPSSGTFLGWPARGKLGEGALGELLGGERDVFAAGCSDQLSGLHGPADQPCPARPWVRLLCPLAVFAPRHLPNLMRLRAYFARQWHLMAAPAFLSVFGPYAQRLDELLTPACFEESALRRAAGQVTDRGQ